MKRLSSPPSPLYFLPLYLSAAQQKTLHKTPQKTLNLHTKLPIFNYNINQIKNRSKPIIKLTSIKRFGEKLKQNKHNLLIGEKSKPEWKLVQTYQQTQVKISTNPWINSSEDQRKPINKLEWRSTQKACWSVSWTPLFQTLVKIGALEDDW